MKILSRSVVRKDLLVCLPTEKLIALMLLIASGVTVLSPNGVRADDESDRGRLADGRAFRTDSEGNQLVDYIAELEVNAENLKTQVSGLESELREKQATIERMRASGALDTPVSEKTLSDGESGSGGRANVVSGARSAESDAGSRNFVPEPSCGEQTQKIAYLSGELESAQADLQVERQLSTKRLNEAQETQSGLQKELSERAEQLASLSAELGEVRAMNVQLNEALAKSRMKIVSAERRSVREEPRALGSSDVFAAEGADVRAALGGPDLVVLPKGNQLEQVGGATSGNLSEARLRAVEVVRGKVRTDLNQLRGLVASRDQAYQRYRQGSQRVSFKPQPAKTSQGASIKDLETKLSNATSVSEAAKIGREISQIRSRMNEDIALMKRTMR